MSILLNNWIGPILGFVVGLIPLIILHEFGHFLMARVFGVWAREFGIGYPPRITKLFRWRETVFTLNWLPIGGFVRLEGEELFEEPGETEDSEHDQRDQRDQREAEDSDQEAWEAHSLYAKSPAERTVIYLGGPLMNLISAWVIGVLLFLTGYPTPTGQVVIREVAPNSPAAQANIQEGDIVLAIQGEPVEGTEDLIELTQENLGTPTEMKLQYDGETRTVTLVPRTDPPENQGAMGVIISEDVDISRYPLGRAVVEGTRYVGAIAGVTVLAPIYIIRGVIPLSQGRPVGIIGISQITHRSIETSIETGALFPFLNILIMISVGLGIFNLLPIPALDGGRILFALVEKVRGKRLTPELEERIHIIAFVLMLALVVFITALDIISPVPMP
jgi:regulator of sigma E protease